MLTTLAGKKVKLAIDHTIHFVNKWTLMHFSWFCVCLFLALPSEYFVDVCPVNYATPSTVVG